MTSLSKVSGSHRYINDLTMSIVVVVLVAGFGIWEYFRICKFREAHTQTVNKVCPVIASTGGKPTRIQDDQCQMEISKDVWITLKLV